MGSKDSHVQRHGASVVDLIVTGCGRVDQLLLRYATNRPDDNADDPHKTCAIEYLTAEVVLATREGIGMHMRGIVIRAYKHVGT